MGILKRMSHDIAWGENRREHIIRIASGKKKTLLLAILLYDLFFFFFILKHSASNNNKLTSIDSDSL